MLFLSYRFLFLRSLTDALFGRNLRSQAIIQISCQTDLPGQRVPPNGHIRTLPSPIPTQCLTPARQKVYNYRVKGIYLCTETYIPFKREVYTYCKVRLRGSQRPLGCVAQKSIKTPRHLSMPGQTTLTIMKQWCHQESNRGHKDFQSFALPTELWHPPCFRGKSTCTASVSLETECKGTIFFQTTNTFPFRRSEQIGFSIVLPRGRVPKRALVPARKL